MATRGLPIYSQEIVLLWEQDTKFNPRVFLTLKLCVLKQLMCCHQISLGGLKLNQEFSYIIALPMGPSESQLNFSNTEFSISIGTGKILVNSFSYRFIDNS